MKKYMELIRISSSRLFLYRVLNLKKKKDPGRQKLLLDTRYISSYEVFYHVLDSF